MDIIRSLIDLFLHLDEHLGNLVRMYGFWTHFILLAIIFCETGLVVTPFLPGDSLLLAAGALAAQYPDALNIALLFVLLSLAAILGDSVNYAIGNSVGMRVFDMNLPFLMLEYLDRTHEFYEKYGGKTIIVARFVPIVRTFAPFVAGVGKMSYRKFITYNVIGGIVWVGLFLMAGYLFGGIPFIQKNFELVALAIVLVSVLPMIFEYIKSRRAAPARSQAS
jgi:membrane-associated protein